MNTVNDVKRVNHWCHKTLPLAYDDSLSYYETVCKLVAKINEMVDTLNNVTVDVIDEANAYTDSAIVNGLKSVADSVERVNNVKDTLLAQYEATIEEANRLKNELNEEYAKFMNLTNSQLLLFNNRMDAYDKELYDAVVGVNARTDLAIEQNNDYIISEVGKGYVDVKVRNYFTGRTESLQDMFDYLATLHIDNSIDYNALAGKNVTFDTLKSRNIMYTELALYGGALI